MMERASLLIHIVYELSDMLFPFTVDLLSDLFSLLFIAVRYKCLAIDTSIICVFPFFLSAFLQVKKIFLIAKEYLIIAVKMYSLWFLHSI